MPHRNKNFNLKAFILSFSFYIYFYYQESQQYKIITSKIQVFVLD
jgi:hypothetical protein